MDYNAMSKETTFSEKNTLEDNCKAPPDQNEEKSENRLANPISQLLLTLWKLILHSTNSDSVISNGFIAPF